MVIWPEFVQGCANSQVLVQPYNCSCLRRTVDCPSAPESGSRSLLGSTDDNEKGIRRLPDATHSLSIHSVQVVGLERLLVQLAES